MKLLFDNNLSFKLVARLVDEFPKSSHVMFEKLDESDDLIIWDFAKNNDFTIVTKDSDFNELSVINGFPPKVIWISIGNCKIKDIVGILKNNHDTLNIFYNSTHSGFIEIK